MRIEIINTGSELLLGTTLNTHGAWIGQRLMEMGLRVQRQVTVPDGDPIRAALKESIEVSDVVIVTGGIGPTSDDVTREATAEAIGVELIEDEHAVRMIEAFFANLNRPMTPSNLKQAMNPCGADVLPNPNGTAPGVYVPPRLGGASPCAIFCLPGPPREMHGMFQAEVEPRLRSMVNVSDDYGITEIKFSGVGESRFQDALDAELHAVGDIEVGYCARPGELDLRLIGTHAKRIQAGEIAKQRYPDSFINDDGKELEQTVVELLIQKGFKLALAESCTGGRIASRVTDVPGASSVFTHGFVTYSNESKGELLGVKSDLIAHHGAVSEEVAVAMARGAVENSGADFAVSVTGIAGPSGGSDEKPVGTVFIGIAWRGEHGIEAHAEKGFHPNGRAVFKERVSQAALMVLLVTLRDA